jgi:hypothetical protein
MTLFRQGSKVILPENLLRRCNGMWLARPPDAMRETCRAGLDRNHPFRDYLAARCRSRRVQPKRKQNFRPEAEQARISRARRQAVFCIASKKGFRLAEPKIEDCA